MSEHDNGFGFPHDGEHGRNCTGFGCDCDHEKFGNANIRTACRHDRYFSRYFK